MYRKLVVDDYLVFYVVIDEEATIEIHRIINGKIDYSNLLETQMSLGERDKWYVTGNILVTNHQKRCCGVKFGFFRRKVLLELKRLDNMPKKVAFRLQSFALNLLDL